MARLPVFVFTLLIACLFVISAPLPSARADGVFIPPSAEKLPDIPHQRALIKYRNGIESLVVQSTADGKAERFGWLLPVPAVPQRLEIITPGLLETIALQMSPAVIGSKNVMKDPIGVWIALFYFVGLISLAIASKKHRFAFIIVFFISLALAFFFGSILGSYRSPGMARFNVEVIETQTLGSYDVTVLRANTEEDLNRWLAENQYRTMGSMGLSVARQYIQDGWVFVAARLKKPTAGAATPHPLLIEFPAATPVYPMRLTALPASDLYLQLFILAEEEAVPLDVPLRKIAAFRFYSKSKITDDSRTVQAHEGYQGEGNRAPQIAHPDAFRLMWNNCVLARFDGRISPSQMKADLYFDFQNFSPYRTTIYSYRGALVYAGLLALKVLLVAMPVLALLYRRFVVQEEKSGTRRFLFCCLCAIVLCSTIFGAAYVWVGPKTKANELPHLSALKNMYNILHAFAADYDNIKPPAGRDLETYIEQKVRESLSLKVNPFTGEPLKIGHGPGDFWIMIEDGEFVGFTFYWADGFAERISYR